MQKKITLCNKALFIPEAAVTITTIQNYTSQLLCPAAIHESIWYCLQNSLIVQITFCNEVLITSEAAVAVVTVQGWIRQNISPCLDAVKTIVVLFTE